MEENPQSVWDRFWEDPEKILLLIDLLFLDQETNKVIPS